MLITHRRSHSFMPETRHVLCQRCDLGVLGTGEPSQIVSRKVFPPNVFRCILERVVEHPIVDVTPAPSRNKQQRFWISRNILCQMAFDVLADMRRDGDRARIAGFRGVDAAPAILTAPMRDRPRDSDHRAIGVEILAAQFGYLPESHSAPSGQQYE